MKRNEDYTELTTRPTLKSMLDGTPSANLLGFHHDKRYPSRTIALVGTTPMSDVRLATCGTVVKIRFDGRE